VDTGSWLTAARAARLPQVLRAIRSHPPPGVPLERAPRVIWRACGGPLDEVSDLIQLLVRTGLVISGIALRLTPEGRTIATQDHQSGGTLIARSLIRAGHFADQARRVTECGQLEPCTGDLLCARKLAVEAAPQLVGMLRRFTGVQLDHQLRVPSRLLRDLIDFWALLPEASSNNADDGKKAIGDRGELYSYQLERMRSSNPTHVRWVARDSDSLGYDIEDSSLAPARLIEVKASALRTVRFILSANEWRVAHRSGELFEVHFWGGIDLSRPPAAEYELLRSQGFPLIYKDIPQQLFAQKLFAQPTHYLFGDTPPSSP
jgi:uncharacterized protein DUF3883